MLVPSALLARRLVASMGAISALAAPIESEAWIVAAFAVAATVLSIMAANKRSDGGLGAMLSANLEIQKAISEQIASVQTAIAHAIAEMTHLEKQTQEVIHLERVRAVTDGIGGAAFGFDGLNKRARSGTFTSFQQWVDDKSTQEDVSRYYTQLDNSFDVIQHNNWYDATTAIYLPLAANLALALRSARGDGRNNRSEAQRYIDAFDRVLDTRVETSAAARFNRLKVLYAIQVERLSRLGWNVPTEANSEESMATLFAVRVRDDSRAGEPNEVVVVEDIVVTPRDGPATTYFYRLKVRQVLLTSNLAEMGRVALRQFQVDDSVALVEGETVAALTPADRQQRQPEDNLDESELPNSVPGESFGEYLDEPTWAARYYIRADAQTGEARRKAASDHRPRSSDKTFLQISTQRQTDFSTEVDRLNAQIAETALCLSSLATVSAVRAKLLSQFRQGGELAS